MITGLNQNIEVLDRQFHVQTEVIEGAETKCRTTVYSGGTIIGNREANLSSGLVDEDEIRKLMEEQHTLIIENLICRLEEIAEAEGIEKQPVTPPKPLRDSKPLPKKQALLPSIDDVPGLRSSVRVRELLAGFRNDIELDPPATTAELRLRLENALLDSRKILTSPVFSETRLDEQVRFYDLEERISAWLMHEPDHAKGVTIWCEVAVFSSYLGRINNRSELIDYDRKLLLWAFSKIGATGLTKEVLESLQALLGREPRFDRMLNDPDLISKNEWLSMLVELLDSL